MRVPLTWLQEYVDLPAEPQTLVDRWTIAGLEATSVESFGQSRSPLPWDADRVVVARVLKIEKHPDADKLKLVTLDYGAATPKTVITGAPNIAPGQSGMKVILGLQGTRYYYTNKEGQKAIFTLEPKALRGIMNDAMCMSEFELGISEEHEGIILLDESDPAPGTPIAEFLSETVVDLDILPNMARCLGLIGLAREVSALTKSPVRLPEAPMLPAKSPVTSDQAAAVEVEIADAKRCARYSAIVLDQVTVGPAPRAMRSRLRYAGMRPISNIVDITNYVMLETGRPLHAFDYDVLCRRAAGAVPKIMVRPARAGESLVTLDGVLRELTAEHLVIADATGPIALAGVMGGLETEVTPQTRRLLLESADFDFVSIRKTARHFNLFSEASTRYSRGIHPDTVAFAARRAVALFQTHAGARIVSPWVDVYPAPPATQTVPLARQEIERVLGFLPTDAEIVAVLEALEFRLTETLWGWDVTVPPTRLDIQAGPADLIEELARILGYDHLPSRLLPLELPPQANPEALLAEAQLQDQLVATGLQEIIQYSLSAEAAEGPFAPPGVEPVRLVNPISPERSILRRSLLPGLIEVAVRNLRERSRVRLFEIGPVYLAEAHGLPREPKHLGVILGGRRKPSTWDDPLGTTVAMVDFYDLKGLLEPILPPDVQFVPLQDHAGFHPGRAARIVWREQTLGTLGELHPRLAAPLKLGDKPLILAELSLEQAWFPRRRGFQGISVYPRGLRDLAAVVPQNTPADRVLAEIRLAGGELLEAVELFDVYQGESIPAGTRSLAFTLTYRAADRPLGDKEIDKLHGKIEGRLKHVLGASIRGQNS